MSRFSRIALAAALLSILSACDILRSVPFEVVEWSPGPGFHEFRSFSAVRARFSTEPDRTSVESAFTLEEDGSAIRGNFSWEGKTLTFTPYSPFSGEADYVLSLREEAQDEDGVSMDSAFEQRFTTRADGPRPRVASTYPPDGEALPSATSAVEIVFTTPVDAPACRDFISFSPSRAGSWSVNDAGTAASFLPADPWPLGADTAIVISADFRDREGRRSGVEHRSSFHIGNDRIEPSLVKAEAVDTAGTAVLLSRDDQGDSVVTENRFWEGTWKLRLTFSEPVDLSSLDSRLTVEAGPTLTRETEALRASSAVYRFSERPEWGGRFAYRVEAGVSDGNGNTSSQGALFRIVADGPRSRPPRFIGLRLPLNPADGAVDPMYRVIPVDGSGTSLGIDATYYPTTAVLGTKTKIELYFELAEGATLNPYSIMDKFSVKATNNALSFSAKQVTTGGTDPLPYSQWASYERYVVIGMLINRTDAGIVTFTLAEGFADSAGNEIGAATVLPLNK